MLGRLEEAGRAGMSGEVVVVIVGGVFMVGGSVEGCFCAVGFVEGGFAAGRWAVCLPCAFLGLEWAEGMVGRVVRLGGSCEGCEGCDEVVWKLWRL